jgi:hypothetical protein
VEDLAPGIYEVLVTEGLRARLDELADSLPNEQRALHAAETPDRIAWHLSREIERALADVGESDRVRVGIEVARGLLDRLGELVGVDPSVVPLDAAMVLHSILRRRPDGSPERIAQPLIPLLDTTRVDREGCPRPPRRSRGSSNLTHSAQVTGIEWNVRASAARNPDVIAKFGAVFDSYWAGGDYLPYDPVQFEEQQRRAGRTDTGPQVILSPIELRLFPFQERLLELVEVSRQRGYHHNLLVAGTGTGKTVMAALDYAELREQLDRSRLLFIAHREEILDQSLATFRYALRDPSFGEKWVGGSRPTRFEHVFASIQSLHANDLSALPPDHFDVVIVDEFHHAAASSYERVLDHLEPIELLGLTATPERSDGLPILHWFHDRIAAELRLWDAIDQQHLAPSSTSASTTGSSRGEAGARSRGCRVDARPGVLRERRARPVHETTLQPSRHPIGRDLGRQPQARARGRLARSCRREDQGRVLRRLVQRGCRRSRGRHRSDAPPDREPHALPAATRPGAAQGQGHDVLHRAGLRRHPNGRYSRIEILAAMGLSGDRAKIAAWQSGVYEAKPADAELLAFTLDKSSGGFSPTTRYRDYALSRTLIHWESQSSTREESPTGLRYRNHECNGRTILLFTRLRADDRAFWFLGPATYRGHVGEKPMAITWELDVPLPGDLYAAFAAAVA